MLVFKTYKANIGNKEVVFGQEKSFVSETHGIAMWNQICCQKKKGEDKKKMVKH